MRDLVITHVHAVATDPGTGVLLAATHEGLIRLDQRPRRIGPVVDLMGFTIRADGTYLASGHPGLGTDLPNPVGLLTSRDRGRTWQPRSRAGESDFHALAATKTAVIAYDGTLRVSTDLTSWTQRAIPAPPRTLSASTTGTVLATTSLGLLATSNDARTWARITTPLLPLVAAWASPRVIVAASTTGRLMLSRDAGRTWTTGTTPVGQVDAISGTMTGDRIEIVYASETLIRRSRSVDTAGALIPTAE